MKRNCIRCDSSKKYEIPVFADQEKEELILMKKESSIKTVKALMDHFKLTHAVSKFIVLHINTEYGKCNRCETNNLKEEYINCPKCKALNFNWSTNRV